MKNMNWKKKGYRLIGLSLMLAALGSCGSDNKVEVTTAEDVSTSTATVTYETSSCVTTSSYSEFRERVANMAFVSATSTRESYYYYECEEKDGWFGIDYDSCSVSGMIRSQNTDFGSVRHEGGSSREGVRDYLLSIIDNAVDAVGGGTYYDIESSNGELHRISLCQPMVANPTAWASDDGDESYRFYSKSYY